jgi:hypothetical protein
MESQQIGKGIQIEGLSGKLYLFILRKANHDFSKRKPCSGLFFFTKDVIKSGVPHQRILGYGTVADLSKVTITPILRTKLVALGATNMCLLTRTKPSGIEKVEKDLVSILNRLEKI